MKAGETNVLEFIGGFDKVFEIPPFQRNYEWTYEQCKELFNDIEKSYYNKRNHYLGNVVFYKGERTNSSFTDIILIDGQQRITTIELLLCAIRDLNNGNFFNDRINDRYLINSTSDGEVSVRLRQTSIDYDSFVALILNRPIDNPNSNIIKNYQYFKKLLSESKISLEDFYNTIIKLEFVEVNLEIENDLEAVQTIFEKINSTGKPLSAADLIRNYLLISTSIEEQENLYNQYWTNIESTVGSEYISLLAKYYTVIKTLKNVDNSNIYSTFKNYFSMSNFTKEDILIEMTKYAPYFAWLKNNSCPDLIINDYVKELNVLKTDDAYPLYLYLFLELYDTKRDELRKIFSLLAAFFIRYRIVSPAGGGGALQTLVHYILDNFINDGIDISYNFILHELSNMTSKSNRFPNNEEFKDALLKSKKSNSTYGKVLLKRIEEYDNPSVKLPLEKINLEFIMPKKLSNWWIKYLGGNEQASQIYETYSNCIGNLTLVEPGYSSKQTDEPWDTKKSILSKVQLNLTNNLSNLEDWKEDDIKNRNEILAEKACEVILGPLPRENANFDVTVDSGVYNVEDLDINVSGTSIEDVLYKDESLGISSWRGFFLATCKICCELNSEKFNKIVSNNIIHKSTMKQISNKYDPVIVTEDVLKEYPNILVTPVKIEETNYYGEASLSAERVKVYAKQLMDEFKIANEFKICIENNDLD